MTDNAWSFKIIQSNHKTHFKTKEIMNNWWILKYSYISVVSNGKVLLYDTNRPEGKEANSYADI